MSNFVDISFDCLPLRSVPRFDVPLDDAEPEVVEFTKRVRQAVAKHGQFNTYYLHDGQCVFHLTNDEKIGMISFRFEGTVLADSDDLKTLDCDLEIELSGEVCDWLTAGAVSWLTETVTHAVRIEFDRYIQAGDLKRTIERLEKLARRATPRVDSWAWDCEEGQGAGSRERGAGSRENGQSAKERRR